MTKRAPLRARDLRANIAELGFEKGVVLTLELLLDEFVGLREQLMDMADVQSRTIDTISNIAGAAKHIHGQLEEMKRKEEQHDATRGEGIVPIGDE